MQSAVILPVGLPAPLEAFRQGHVGYAPLGLPAHVTLLYPWLPAERLGDGHFKQLLDVLTGAEAFDFVLATIERWPTVLYAAPHPTAPFNELVDRLAAAWPEWPLYGGLGMPFEPHVTLAEPADDAAEAAVRPLAAGCLPAPRRAAEVTVIVEAQDQRWRTLWRLLLRAARA